MNVLSDKVRNSPQYAGFLSFMDTCILYDEALSIPVRFLWVGYLRYCNKYGFPKTSPRMFKVFLACEPRTKVLQVEPRSDGYIHSVVNGAAINPMSVAYERPKVTRRFGRKPK